MLTFVETKLFTQLVAQYLSDGKYCQLHDALATHPEAGDVPSELRLAGPVLPFLRSFRLQALSQPALRKTAGVADLGLFTSSVIGLIGASVNPACR